MVRAGCLGAVCGAIALLASTALAATQFNWNPALTGAQNWTVSGNWDQAGFPNAPTHVANLSGPLAASLAVDLGTNEIKLAGLTLGSTNGAIETSVTGGGGLMFQNDDATFNNGNALVTSTGAVGSNNVVSVHTRLNNEPLEFGSNSTSSVRFSELVYAVGATPSIRSFMPAGVQAKINILEVTDPDNPANYRRFRLNDSAGSPAGMSGVSTQGTLEIGEIFGYGELSIGMTAGAHPVPLGTVILSGASSFVGYVQLNRANVVLANDYALGTYGLFGGQPNQGVGFNLISNDDARTVNVPVEISQWLSIKGEHSLTWGNIVAQSNSRGWINLLPAGKTFTLTGGQYAVVDEDTERTFSFDGTGRTLVTGGLHDKYIFASGPADDGIGHFRKTGTGAVVVSSAQSSFHGTTIIEAGVLRFADGSHLANTSAIVSTGGALGVDTGILSNAVLLAKIDAADTGGLMLTPAEAAANLDFTTGPLANAANISVAAPEDGIAYTGTITPANNTYRLGGGSGTLTLPNQNQLTGSRGLIVTNGGEVRLNATNDYTGPTVISDYAFTSRTNQAIADTTTGVGTQLYAPTTLTISSFKSGGLDSSIGKSSNDPSNLVIQGSTLRHDGASDKIQRLFTVGSRGATIESVGASRIFFENDGALAMEPGGAGATRTLTLVAESPVNGMRPVIQDAMDGGVVGLTKEGGGMWELFGDNSYSGPTTIRQGRLNVNGTQSGGGDCTIDAGATLGGTGVVGGNVIAAGTISPGRSVGTLEINGDLGFSTSGGLEIEIVGTAAGQYDRLEVSGTAALGGTLRVELPNQVGSPYVPKLGDQFGFLAASGGAGGMFDAFDLPALAAGLAWELNPGNVTVFLAVVAALPGDYNFNGVVDAADYTVWRDSFGQEGIGLAADGDHNSIVDGEDYAVWKSQFGTTLGSGGSAAAEAAVAPEPASVVILVVALAGLISFCPSARRS